MFKRNACFLFFICQKILASTALTPPDIGNFSLPPSQQPGPFYSFGQNIIDKNQVQFFFLPTFLKNVNEYTLTTGGSLLYGLTDQASVLITFPLAAENHQGDKSASGYQDMAIQTEYAYYDSSTSEYRAEATFLGSVTLPTASTPKIPALGNGSPSYFLGTTYNRTYVDWIFFASLGESFYATHENVTKGEQSFIKAEWDTI